MEQEKSYVLVTGGSGFIGSHFVRHLYTTYPQYRIVNLDALTYAGNPENLKDIEAFEKDKSPEERRYEFVSGDVCDEALIRSLFERYAFTFVFHFAAETHVDRSLFNFSDFVRTNVEGIRVLLDAARRYQIPRLIHISTDEVYGNVLEGHSTEESPYNPSSPYSASKAAGDMLAKTYAVVYNVPVIIVRGANNYGTHQYPEKLIPLTITNLLEGKMVPVHGNGRHIRSWLHVQDFCDAIDLLAHQGPTSGIYNVAGEHRTNLEIIHLVAGALGKKPEDFITHVNDRPSADLRYAPFAGKLEREFGWKPRHSLHDALPDAISWYRHNTNWWKAIKAKKEFLDHYEKQSKAQWY